MDNKVFERFGFTETAENTFRALGRLRGYRIADNDEMIELTYNREFEIINEKATGVEVNSDNEMECFLAGSKFWRLGGIVKEESSIYEKLNARATGQKRAIDRLKDEFLANLLQSINTKTGDGWLKPWNGKGAPLAVNWETGRPYTGINQAVLPAGEYVPEGKLAKLKEKDENIKSLGWHSYNVMFYKKGFDVENDETGEKEHVDRWFGKLYKVRPITDLQGLETKFKPDHRFDHDETAKDAYIMDTLRRYCEDNGLKLMIDVNQNRAFYCTDNTIHVPEIGRFEHKSEFYSTLFHECIHSTAVKLDRKDGANKRNEEGYAKEELIAEIGAALLCRHFGIVCKGMTENTREYLAAWYKHIKDEDSRYLVSACTQANKAADLIASYK